MHEEDTCMSYEEEDTCMSYEEEDTCMSYEEEDTCMSYEEEDTCDLLRPSARESYPSPPGEKISLTKNHIHKKTFSQKIIFNTS